MISEAVITDLYLFGQNDKLFQNSYPFHKLEFLDFFFFLVSPWKSKHRRVHLKIYISNLFLS